MVALSRVALASIVGSWGFAEFKFAGSIHPELMHATTTEEKFNIVSNSNSRSLLEALPEEIAGENMTLDNFHKYFNVTLAYHGPARNPMPKVATPRMPPSNFTNRALLNRRRLQEDPIGDATKLLNLFQSEWDFVKKNQGVVTIQEGSYAGATPEGVDWTAIRFDQEPTIIPEDGGQYQAAWKNGFNAQCGEIYYRLHWYAHGRYTSEEDGYITQFTQIVDHAHASFGHEVNAKSSVSPPVNVGQSAPVGALTMSLDLWAGSAHQYLNLVVRGDGSCEYLGDNAGHCRDATPAPTPAPTPPSYYKTITPSDNTNQCLDLPGDSAYDGAQLWLWQCNGGESQRWVFDNYQIRFGADESKCIDAGDMSDGLQLFLWDCNGASQQTWGYDSDASRIYLDGSRTCMDSYADWNSNGQPLHIWECNGAGNQEWSLWNVDTGKVADMLLV